MLGLNPPQVVISSAMPLPMKGNEVTTLEPQAAGIHEESLGKV
jgi:hypothetical protein